jgi:hypothetical protein
MINLLRLQDLVLHRLLSDPLQTLNIEQFRKLKVEQGTLDTVWLTPRNGRSGCGLLVEMPTIRTGSANIRDSIIDCPVVAIEEPNLNYAPETGTQVSAEEAALNVRAALDQWSIGGVGILHASGRWAQPANEFENLVAYRVTLSLEHRTVFPPKVAKPALSESGGLHAITCSTAGASIYYTLDGTYPGPSNPGAMMYISPIAAGTGDTITAAAYLEDYTGSDMTSQTIN